MSISNFFYAFTMWMSIWCWLWCWRRLRRLDECDDLRDDETHADLYNRKGALAFLGLMLSSFVFGISIINLIGKNSYAQDLDAIRAGEIPLVISNRSVARGNVQIDIDYASIEDAVFQIYEQVSLGRNLVILWDRMSVADKPSYSFRFIGSVRQLDVMIDDLIKPAGLVRIRRLDGTDVIMPRSLHDTNVAAPPPANFVDRERFYTDGSAYGGNEFEVGSEPGTGTDLGAAAGNVLDSVSGEGR